ncbi:MAG: CIA30 family protein [Lysobacterales bacterium]
MTTPAQTLMDFSDSDQTRWYAVNDGVMGGLSQGAPVRQDGQLRFSGVLSLANNGGFSSVRTSGRSFDLSGIEALRLRVKGDGRSYQLRLATDARFRGSPVSYGATFATEADRWIEVRIPLDDLKPSYRGYQLEGPPLDPARVQEIGLLIGDKREGAFSLLVDSIAAE